MVMAAAAAPLLLEVLLPGLLLVVPLQLLSAPAVRPVLVVLPVVLVLPLLPWEEMPALLQPRAALEERLLVAPGLRMPLSFQGEMAAQAPVLQAVAVAVLPERMEMVESVPPAPERIARVQAELQEQAGGTEVQVV